MNHIPRKRFGQNFLIDTHIIDKIVAAINPQREDNIVEIGPGLGALTTCLLPRLNALHVIEIDRDLIARLISLQNEYPALVVHNNDALQFDFANLGIRPLRIIGNLPYNISTPLLFHLFSYCDFIDDMHFMLQKEVVDRLTATPGSADYGRLSVMVQYHAEAVRLFNVKPGSFNPAPKVDSAVVRMQIRQLDIPADDEKHFAQVVKQAFAQRRKTLRNNLKGLIDGETISDCGIDPNTRAETLTVAEFVRLSNRTADQPWAQ